MRILKFRAWHHGGGDPRVAGDMSYSHPFPILFWQAIEDEALAVEIMQYTGLIDRNDKEIYEGDIVKIRVEKQFNDVKEIGIVKFSDDLQFVIHDIDRNWENKSGLPLTWGGYLSLEIIGNIWQNPELVGEQ